MPTSVSLMKTTCGYFSRRATEARACDGASTKNGKEVENLIYSAKVVNTLRWREKGREEEESLKMPHIIPKMFATDACVKDPLFYDASPLRHRCHSVAYVMAEGRCHHTY